MNEGVRWMIQYRENVGWDEFKENEAGHTNRITHKVPKMSAMKGDGPGGKGGKGGGSSEFSGPPQKKYPQTIKNRATKAQSRVYSSNIKTRTSQRDPNSIALLSDGSDEGASLLTYAGIVVGVVLLVIVGAVVIKFSMKK